MKEWMKSFNSEKTSIFNTGTIYLIKLLLSVTALSKVPEISRRLNYQV